MRKPFSRSFNEMPFWAAAETRYERRIGKGQGEAKSSAAICTKTVADFTALID
jgi:hypothetical protein